MPMSLVATQIKNDEHPVQDAHAYAVKAAHREAGCPPSCLHRTWDIMVPSHEDPKEYDLQVTAECYPNEGVGATIKTAQDRGRGTAYQEVDEALSVLISYQENAIAIAKDQDRHIPDGLLIKTETLCQLRHKFASMADRSPEAP
jgi:hypothetical protein